MGIIDKKQVLYLSTGNDNSGGYAGMGLEMDFLKSYQQLIKNINQSTQNLFSVENANQFNQLLVNVDSELRDIAATISNVLGSGEQTRTFMIELQKYSLKSIFDFRELSEYAALLLTLGINIEELIPLLDNLSNLSAGTDIPLQRLVELYSKVVSEGGLSKSDIDDWGRAGESLLKSIEVLYGPMGLFNMLEEGKINIKEFSTALNTLTGGSGVFAGSMEKQMDVGRGSLSLLKNSVLKVYTDAHKIWDDMFILGENNKPSHKYSLEIDTVPVTEGLQELLDKYKDYDEERLKIEKKYDEEIQTLEKNRKEKNSERIDKALVKLERAKSKELSVLSFSELKDTDYWDKVISNLNKMGVGTIQELLKEAKKVNTETWNVAQIKEYETAVQNLESAIKSRNPFLAIKNDWDKFTTAISGGDSKAAGEALTGISTGTGEIIKNLNTLAGGIKDVFGEEAGYAATQVVELTTALNGFAEGAGKIVSGDILGGVSSLFGSVGKLFSMGKKTKEQNAAARAEQQNFYDKIIKSERDYQALLRDRQRTEANLGKIAIERNLRVTTELDKQKQEVNAEYKKLWTELQGQRYVSDIGYQHGTWFRKATTWNIYDSLAGKSYEDIEKLFLEGKLEEKTAQLFQQLQKLKGEGADIDKMLADQAQSFREYLSGMTFDGLVNSIKSAFDDGKMDIQETADFTKEVFKKAILQALEAKILQERLAPFLESFQADAVNGTLFNKMDYYENWLNQIAKDGNEFMESLMNIPSIAEIFKINEVVEAASASDNTLKGAYARASQESIDMLAGQTGAQRVAIENIKEITSALMDIQIKGWTEVTAIRNLNEQIEENSRQVAHNAEEIQKISEKIYEQTQKAASSLNVIENHGVKAKINM